MSEKQFFAFLLKCKCNAFFEILFYLSNKQLKPTQKEILYFHSPQTLLLFTPSWANSY